MNSSLQAAQGSRISQIASRARVDLSSDELSRLEALDDAREADRLRLDKRFFGGEDTPEQSLAARRHGQRWFWDEAAAIVGEERAERLFSFRVLEAEMEGYPEWLAPAMRWAAPLSTEASLDKQNVLVDLFSSFTMLASLNGYKAISDAFSSVKAEECSDLFLIALLRGSFRFRDRIDSWGDLLDRTRATFEQRGRDTDKVLMGLSVAPAGSPPGL